MNEQIYECEVKRPFRNENGEREMRWTTKPVSQVIEESLTEYRCKDCPVPCGSCRHVPHGPAPHAEHRSRQDSEYCPAGHYFKQNPGRMPRLSENPVL